METVTGIGGLMFRSKDPDALGKWYRENLGVNLVSPDADESSPWMQEAGPTAFTPLPEDTDYFAKNHAWSINFRVRNLDKMVAQLKRAKIKIKVNPETFSFGRFASLTDPEGNPIELWEPK